ncbi:Mg2+/citrate symporter [Pseudorhizobium tarimense]|uniref:Mg2+/citrate symporter n=1 Tax=Pseudorhizobium tarimense TaxID=1079109 RepID=A0ABV2H6B5_9HYPH
MDTPSSVVRIMVRARFTPLFTVPIGAIEALRATFVALALQEDDLQRLPVVSAVVQRVLEIVCAEGPFLGCLDGSLIGDAVLQPERFALCEPGNGCRRYCAGS